MILFLNHQQQFKYENVIVTRSIQIHVTKYKRRFNPLLQKISHMLKLILDVTHFHIFIFGVGCAYITKVQLLTIL